jgi:signal transduction histidine kinase
MSTIATSASPAETKPVGRSGGRTWSSLVALSHRPGFWVAMWTAGVAGAVAALWPVLFGDGSVTTANSILRATGGSFVAAGLVAWQRRPTNRVGALMVATGLLVYVEVLASDSDASVVKTFGLLVAGYWTISFVILLLVFPQGRWIAGLRERFLVLAFAVHLVLQFFWLLFLEMPSLSNDLGFFPSQRAADAIRDTQTVVLLIAAVSLLFFLGWRWWKASPPLRRVLVPVLVGGATMLSLGVMLTLELISGTRSQSLLLLTLGVLAAVPLAFLGALLRSRMARVAVADLLLDLRGKPSGDEVREALARSLGDRSLELVYWLPDFDTYVDLDGRVVDLPDEEDGRAVTPIETGGVRFAALIHDETLVQEPELLAAATAAASIALENARLQAELAARLEEVKGSRLRAIEAGQRERKRLERDLHDGAQQRLVALSLRLRRLGRTLDPNPDLEKQLDEAERELALSLDELRDLAHGIHPADLSGHGLAVALEEVGARAPVPVRMSVAVEGRLPESVEVAAYYVVTESLANMAKHARATTARVDVEQVSGSVVVEIVDDGIGGADSEAGSGIRGLADRVEALGGRVLIWSPSGGGTRVRAEIPCV